MFPSDSVWRQKLDFWCHTLIETVDADKLIARGRGFLLAVTLASDGGNADALIRDGTDVLSPVIESLLAINTTDSHHEYSWPKPFVKGLFVDVGSNVGTVTVHYVLTEGMIPS